MWNEVIWIVLGGLALYLITTLLIGWLQSRRKKKDKVIPLIKDFWDEEINRISKANPAYRDSSSVLNEHHKNPKYTVNFGILHNLLKLKN